MSPMERTMESLHFVEFRNAYNSEEYGLLKGMRKEI